MTAESVPINLSGHIWYMTSELSLSASTSARPNRGSGLSYNHIGIRDWWMGGADSRTQSD